LGEKDELTKFLRKQITIENTIVVSLNNSLGEITNQAVKGVLKGISLDSVKHAEMYTAAVKLLTEITPPLTQENLDTQIELVKDHIRLEVELIKKIGDILPNIENEKVSLLLNVILTDEKRHHALLTEVLQILVKGETITEEDWWDLIWKNVPFHGSPGG
jgi:rubrerythrin